MHREQISGVGGLNGLLLYHESCFQMLRSIHVGKAKCANNSLGHGWTEWAVHGKCTPHVMVLKAEYHRRGKSQMCRD